MGLLTDDKEEELFPDIPAVGEWLDEKEADEEELFPDIQAVGSWNDTPEPVSRETVDAETLDPALPEKELPPIQESAKALQTEPAEEVEPAALAPELKDSNSEIMVERLKVSNTNSLYGNLAAAANQEPDLPEWSLLGNSSHQPLITPQGAVSYLTDIAQYAASMSTKGYMEMFDLATEGDVREQINAANDIVLAESQRILGSPEMQYEGNSVEKLGWEIGEAAANMGGALMLGWAFKNPGLTFGAISAQVGGASYNDYMAKTGDHDRSMAKAKFDILAELAGEALPVMAVLKKAKAGQAMSRFLEATLGEGAQEAVTEILQSMYDPIELEGMSFQEAFQDIDWMQVGHAALVGLGVGTIISSPGTASDIYQDQKIKRGWGEGDLIDPMAIRSLEDNQNAVNEAIHRAGPAFARGYKVGDTRVDDVLEMGTEQPNLLGEPTLPQSPVNVDIDTETTMRPVTVALDEPEEAGITDYNASGPTLEQSSAGQDLEKAMAGDYQPKVEVPQTQEDVDQQNIINQAADEAATSSTNGRSEPTDKQKEAGNYKKGKVDSKIVPWLSGMDVMIENPAGSKRNPEWDPLKHPYGYFKRSEGFDNDEVDVIFGPNMAQKPENVFVVDQVDPETGKPDEHKIVLGVVSPEQAKQVYLDNYEDGWSGIGDIKSYKFDDFKQKLKSGFFKNSTPSRKLFNPPTQAERLADFDDQFTAEEKTDIDAKNEKKLVRSQAATARTKANLQPDERNDDLITYIRKLGGINTDIESDVRGRLSHLDQLNKTFGLGKIEQKGDKGRSLDSLGEALIEAGYLEPDPKVGNGVDKDKLIELLFNAEDGKPIFSMSGQDKANQLDQEKHDQDMEDQYENWQAMQDFEDLNDLRDELDAMQDVAPDMDRMAIAGLLDRANDVDEQRTEDILSKDIPDADVVKLLEDLINEQRDTGKDQLGQAAEGDQEIPQQAQAEPAEEGEAKSSVVPSDEQPWIGMVPKKGEAEHYNRKQGEEADWHHNFVVKNTDDYEKSGNLRYVRVGDTNEIEISGDPALSPYSTGRAQITKMADDLISKGVPDDMEVTVANMELGHELEGTKLGTLKDFKSNKASLDDQIATHEQTRKSKKQQLIDKNKDKTVALIACCKTKGAEKAPARELYQSHLFKKQLEYAESLGVDRIFVLSAKHGLVGIDEAIEPYDETLKDMSKEAKKAWARTTFQDIAAEGIPYSKEITVLAGKDYRDDLLPMIEGEGNASIDLPLEGLGIGSQQKRLNELTTKDRDEDFSLTDEVSPEQDLANIEADKDAKRSGLDKPEPETAGSANDLFANDGQLEPDLFDGMQTPKAENKKGQTTVERVKEKLANQTLANVKKMAAEVLIKQTGTKEEIIERMANAREGIEEVEKHESEQDFYDAVKRGEVDRDDLARWASTSSTSGKVSPSGTDVNATTVYHIAKRALKNQAPRPITDEERAVSIKANIQKATDRQNAAFPKKDPVDFEEIENLDEIDTYAGEDLSFVGKDLYQDVIDYVNMNIKGINDYGYDLKTVRHTPNSQLPENLQEFAENITDAGSGLVPLNKRLGAIEKEHKNANPKNTFNALADYLKKVGTANNIDGIKNFTRKNYPKLAGLLEGTGNPEPSVKEIAKEKANQVKKQKAELKMLKPDEFGEMHDARTGLFVNPRGLTRAAKLAKETGFLPEKEADEIMQGWRDEVKRQYDDPDIRSANGQKVILSLFDASGAWGMPWYEAGYDVRKIDLKTDDVDIMDIDQQWFEDYDMTMVHGVLAACPCTDFASSGALDWNPKELGGNPRPSFTKGKDFMGNTHSSIELVNHTLDIIDYLIPQFWALENPVGRINKITGVPDARLTFDPHNYGDPYTKKTMLYGNFGPDLPQANVKPQKDYILNIGSKSEIEGGLRSLTPEGFALAFFMANNDQVRPGYVVAAEEYKNSLPKNYTDIQKAEAEVGFMLGVEQGRIEGEFQPGYKSLFEPHVLEAMETGFYNFQDDWRLDMSTAMPRKTRWAWEQQLDKNSAVNHVKLTVHEQNKKKNDWRRVTKDEFTSLLKSVGLKTTGAKNVKVKRLTDWLAQWEKDFGLKGEKAIKRTGRMTKLGAETDRINGVLKDNRDSSHREKGRLELDMIEITDEDGKTVQTAEWMADDIDSRIKEVNKLRDCI